MTALERAIMEMPTVAGISIGFLLAVYLFLLPSIYTMAGLYPLAFAFAALGVAFFCSFIGAIVGITLNVILEPDFFKKYMESN
jgi:membrane associated rhomboid family serine protease